MCGAVGRCRDWGWRPSNARLGVGRLRLGVSRCISLVRRRLRRRRAVGWLVVHRCPHCGWPGGLVKIRLWVQPLGWVNVSQVRIRTGHRKFVLSPRKVGYQVKMLTLRSGDTEGLFHKPVRLVAISIWLSVILVFVATAARIGSFTTGTPTPRSSKSTSSLSLHLAICEKAPRYAASTP